MPMVSLRCTGWSRRPKCLRAMFMSSTITNVASPMVCPGIASDFFVSIFFNRLSRGLLCNIVQGLICDVGESLARVQEPGVEPVLCSSRHSVARYERALESRGVVDYADAHGRCVLRGGMAAACFEAARLPALTALPAATSATCSRAGILSPTIPRPVGAPQSRVG